MDSNHDPPLPVSVAPFDESVDNFFAAMNNISALCQIPDDDENFDAAEIERFRSMITFLKEWKDFTYEPKTVNFVHHYGDTSEAVASGVNLSQFSSAAVPKMEQLFDKAESNDFVLHAGGPVWGLDWCPRNEESSSSDIKCEYLAVAAHPPGAEYHKIGKPLIGRGLIQIWCVVNVHGKVEDFAPPSKKPSKKPTGRPRKRPLGDVSEDRTYTHGTLGRPKKKPSVAVKKPGSDLNDTPRPRGRPRKHPLPGSTDSTKSRGRRTKPPLPDSTDLTKSCSPVIWADESIRPLNVDLDNVTSSLPASPPGEHESSLPRLKGSPRKKHIPIVDGSPDYIFESINNVSDGKGLSADDVEVALALPASSAPNLREEALEPPSTRGFQKSNMNSLNRAQGDATLPRIVLCLAHHGLVAWDSKWRPSNANTSEGHRHMGYLAVLLGNGSLEVWEVPLPSMVKRVYASCCHEGTDPRYVALKPVFACSKVKYGDSQSIPLTLEWSPSGPCDLILAGCHDGTVSLWKFSTHNSCQDTKPLLCFSADSVPIRALAWAPEKSDPENANLILTAGHEGLKFWDLRDPYHPLWEFFPVQRVILSLDWIKDPRCIILSFDDGTLRTITMSKVLSDVPATGKTPSGTKPPGVHAQQSSSHAIWCVHMSRATGLVAYCSADGTALHYQLTEDFVEKDKCRHRQAHFLCGSLVEEGQTLNINTLLPNISGCANSLFPALCYGDSHGPLENKSKPTNNKPNKPACGTIPIAGQLLLRGESKRRTKQYRAKPDGDQEGKFDVFPPKVVAMHRVRWNMNKGSERWLCYGGAAGIVRCQAIDYPTSA